MAINQDLEILRRKLILQKEIIRTLSIDSIRDNQLRTSDPSSKVKILR